MLTWDEAYREPVYWMSDVRRRDGASLIRALMRNCRNLQRRCQGRKPVHKREALSTDAALQGRIDS